ncbi:MAG: hypothetical protein H7244_15365 [Herminiimonas sp.]|nr:hypothetical protein [Herminiimonas sp.]
MSYPQELTTRANHKSYPQKRIGTAIDFHVKNSGALAGAASPRRSCFLSKFGKEILMHHNVSQKHDNRIDHGAFRINLCTETASGSATKKDPEFILALTRGDF